MGIANIKQEKKRVPIITLIMMTPKETVWKAEFPRYEGKVPRTFKFTQETRAITGMSHLQFWGSKKPITPNMLTTFGPAVREQIGRHGERLIREYLNTLKIGVDAEKEVDLRLSNVNGVVI